MDCPRCHFAIPATDRYCPACGVDSEYDGHGSPFPGLNPYRGRALRIVGIGLVAVAIIGAFTGHDGALVGISFILGAVIGISGLLSGLRRT